MPSVLLAERYPITFVSVTNTPMEITMRGVATFPNEFTQQLLNVLVSTCMRMLKWNERRRLLFVQYLRLGWLHRTLRLMIFPVLIGIFGLTEGVLEIAPDTPQFGMNLSMTGVLLPLWRAARLNLNLDLIARQRQSFLATHLFMQNCKGVDKWSFICGQRFFLALKSQQYIRFTKFDEADLPVVIWKYWLEPAELLLHVEINFDALMINTVGIEINKNVALLGTLHITIRTEFNLCMVDIEYYSRDLRIRSNGTDGISVKDIAIEDKNALKYHVWNEWIPKFVNEVERVVATRDFCDHFLPLDYYRIVKY